MVKLIENNNFEDVKKAAVAVVDFNATWCGPCKMMAPVLDQAAEQLADKIEFFALDVDDNRELAAQFGIMSIPTLGFFKNGELVDKSVGFMPAPQLQAWLDKNM